MAWSILSKSALRPESSITRNTSGHLKSQYFSALALSGLRHLSDKQHTGDADEVQPLHIGEQKENKNRRIFTDKLPRIINVVVENDKITGQAPIRDFKPDILADKFDQSAKNKMALKRGLDDMLHPSMSSARNQFTGKEKSLQTATMPASPSSRPTLLPTSNHKSSYLSWTRFREQLDIIHACLKSGDHARAIRMLHRLRRSSPDAFAQEVDIHLHNAFLQHLTPADALKWYSELDSCFGVTPNATTFAYLLRGSLTNLKKEATVAILEEIKTAPIKNTVTLEQVVASPALNKIELGRLERTLISMKWDIPAILTERLRAADHIYPISNRTQRPIFPVSDEESGPTLYTKTNANDHRKSQAITDTSISHSSGPNTDPVSSSPDSALSPDHTSPATRSSDLKPVESNNREYILRSLEPLLQNTVSVPDAYLLQERLESDAYQIALQQMEETLHEKNHHHRSSKQAVEDEEDGINHENGRGKSSGSSSRAGGKPGNKGNSGVVLGLMRGWHETVTKKIKEEQALFWKLTAEGKLGTIWSHPKKIKAYTSAYV